MKIRSIALAALTVLAAQAHAITLPAGTPTLYVSGSSALTPVIKAIFGTNATAAGYNTYTNAAGDQILLTATVKKTSTLGTKLGLQSDSLVALFKRDAGGSAYGVNPVATATAIDFLDEVSVSATGANANATTKKVVPQLGAADLEPAQFQRTANLAPGFTALSAADLASLVTSTALLQTFGVAVNNNLYVALQNAQNTTGVPSVSIGQVQSLVNAGGLSGASQSWGYLLNGNGDASQINIARRTVGSGTQAAAQLLFSPFKELPLAASDSDATAPDNSATIFVTESGSTGGVKDALNAADSAGFGNYALGWIGYENKPAAATATKPADTWKFVNLDGVSPDVANASVGAYPFAFENTFNYKSTLAGTPKNFADAIIAEAKNPAVIATLTAPLKTAALPVSASKATRSGNSFNPLKITK